MRRFLRKLLIGIYVFLLCLNTISIDINAVEPETSTDFEVSLEIDESVGDLTGLFDEIGRFSKTGIAKIGKVVSTETYEDEEGNSYTHDRLKYGLMNISGEILLEPIYDYIYDYNDDYYSVVIYGQANSQYGYYHHREGLVSKKDGSIFIEPKYNWIPNFSDQKMVYLNYSEENPNQDPTNLNDDYIWKSEILAHEDGKLTHITVPDGIDLNDFDQYYPYDQNGIMLMNAHSSDCPTPQTCTWESESWLIDEYGNKINDFTFDHTSGSIKIEDVVYLGYQNRSLNDQNTWTSGLLKLSTINGELIVEQFLSEEDGYTSVWIDQYEKKAYFNKKVNDQLQWGYYDFVSKSFNDNSQNNQNYSEKIQLIGFDDIEMSRYCGSDETGVWNCGINVKYVDGSGVLIEGQYDGYNIQNGNNYIVLYDWQQNTTFTNLLYKGNNGNTKVLSTNAFEGYIQVTDSGYVVINSYKENSNYLSLFRQVNDDYQVIVENSKDTWIGNYGNFLILSKRLPDLDTYKYVTSVYDVSSGATVIENAHDFSFNFQADNGLYFGVYRPTADSDREAFVIENNSFRDLGIKTDWFSQFNEYGYALLTRNFEYSCEQYQYNQETTEYEYVNAICFMSNSSLINKKGQILVRDSSYFNFFDDGRVATGTKYILNDLGQIVDYEYKYYYLDNFVNGVQIPVEYSSNEYINFDTLSKIAYLSSELEGKRFVKDGASLELVNQNTQNATSVGRFIDGLLIYQKNVENELKTFVSNIYGEAVEIDGVSYYSGRFVYKDSNYYFIQDMSDELGFKVELLLVEQLSGMSDHNVSHVVGSVYQQWNTTGGQSLFNVNVSNLDSGHIAEVAYFLDENNEVKNVCNVSSNQNLNGLVEFSLMNLNNCDYSKRGLLNQYGQQVAPNKFNWFTLDKGLIQAYSYENNQQSINLYELNGKNILESLGFGDIDFKNIQLQNYPFIQVNDNATNRLIYHVPGGVSTFIGDYNILKIEGTDLFQIFAQNQNNQQISGIIDSKGNTLIDPNEGYFTFNFLTKERVIVPVANSNFVSGVGMFDFEGNRLMSNEFTPELNQDSITGQKSLIVDDRGLVKVFQMQNQVRWTYPYNNFDQSTETSISGWNDNLATQNNFYDLSNNMVAYSKPFIGAETRTLDGFYIVNQLVPSDEDYDALVQGKQSFYYLDENGTKQVLKNKQGVYNKLFETIIAADKYDEVQWKPNLSLVVVINRTCTLNEENSMYCENNIGLVDKTGRIIVEPNFSSVQYLEKYKLFELRNYDDQNTMYINDNGEIVAEGKYNWSRINEDLNWLILQGKEKTVQDIDDSSITFKYQVSDIIDLNTSRRLFEDVRTFGDSQFNRLIEEGHMILEQVQDTAHITERTYYNNSTNTYEISYEIGGGIKAGIIDKNGSFILPLEYDSINELRYESSNQYYSSASVVKGYYTVRKDQVIHQCSSPRFDDSIGEFVLEYYDCQQSNTGVFSIEKGMVVEPVFNNLYQINTDGFATVRKFTGLKEFSYMEFNPQKEEYVTLTYTQMDEKVGVVNVFSGKTILEPKYTYLSSTDPSRMNYSDLPKFDKDGLIKTYREEVKYFENNPNPYYAQFVGLANVNGPVIDGEYTDVYLLNGKYYARKWDGYRNGEWEIFDANDLNNKISVTIDSNESYVHSIEMVNDKIITESKVFDSVEEYSEFGVLNIDMTEFLPFEYNEIKYENGLWYLEKYDALFGSYPRAVMDNDKNFIIPFTDKYDSLSEYVGGYAIGQSGTKEVSESTSALEVPSLLSNFFLDVHAEDDDFVLEIIDEEGRVVGDLSKDYESATLLGEVDGVIRALVQKDGKYFIANLVKTPIQVIRITGVELSNTLVSLKEGDNFQLLGKILPDNHTEKKAVSWSTDNEEVAVVNQDGLIKAVGVGTTIIKFKVNELETYATIHVQSPVVVTPPSEEIKEAVDKLVETIKVVSKPIAEKTLTEKEEFIKQVQSLKEKDEAYLTYLTLNELVDYESKLEEYFGNQINIEVAEGSLPVKFKGLLANLDLDKLISGEQFSFKVNVEKKESIETFKAFIENHQYDESNYHSFDLNIFDSNGNELTEFKYPIEFTLPLPESLRGKGELILLHKHIDEISTLPVTLNIDFTFSFKTDKLSEFALLPNLKRIVEEPNEQSASGGISYTKAVFAGLGLVVIALFIWFARRKRISSI